MRSLKTKTFITYRETILEKLNPVVKIEVRLKIYEESQNRYFE